MLLRRLLCVLFACLSWLISMTGSHAESEEQLPTEPAGTYGFYLSETTPYVRLSPHRCETVDADGKKQPRRITALYSLADLRQYGGTAWSAKTDAYAAAYSISPTATVRSGTRYAMLSPEQAGMDAGTAEKLRAIIACSYPFCTADRMRATLSDANLFSRKPDTIADQKLENTEITTLAQADMVSESELLSAVQTAIWRIAGEQGTLTRVYSETAAPERTERTLHPDPYHGNAAAYAQTEQYVQSISDYLCSLGGSHPQADQPLTAMTTIMVRDTVNGHIRLYLRPNGTIDADDSLLLTVGTKCFSLLRETGEHPVLLSDADGIWMLELTQAELTEKLQISLSGTQRMRKDICLYLPQGGDLSQCLVGMFGGTVEVNLSDTLFMDRMDHRVRLRCITELYEDGKQLPLSDAVFSLYLKDCSHGMIRIAENLRTDADGILEVSGLQRPKDGEHYIFVQTAAPDGYLPAEDSLIYADAAAAVRVENRPAHTAAVELILTDDDGAGIADCGFALYRIFGSEKILIGEYRTDPSGHIAVSKLPMGSYRFCQQQVPRGYAAKMQEYRFQIKENDGTVLVSARNYAYRSVSGTVRFEECKMPQSVNIKLLRDGAVCAEQTVSEETGWAYCFSDIPVLGDYTVEQDPLVGYRSVQQENDIVNYMRSRDVVFRQHADKTENLRGAVFSLHRAEDGKHIRTTASDASGAIVFSDLSVGSYVLRERRAPSGIRAWRQPLYLYVTDPNSRASEDQPLLAYLETGSGERLDDLYLNRQPIGFFGASVRILLPVLLAFVTYCAIVVLRKTGSNRHGSDLLHSGKTRLYLMQKRGTRFIRRICGRYW